MKKRVFTIAFLLASLVSPVQAEENKWYLGTKMGLSHVNPFHYKKHHVQKSSHNSSKEKFSTPIFGAFLGYEFNPYIGLEIENDTNGFSPHLMFGKNKPTSQLNSLQLATKLSYPMSHNFHLYTKLGGMVPWKNLVVKQDLKNMFNKNSPMSATFSVGAEYIFHNKFITRVDYNWKNSIKNLTGSSKLPPLGDVVFSFGWKFGKPNLNNMFRSYHSGVFNKQYTVLNENINFPFNSKELKPIAYDKLDQLDTDIKNMQLKNISIVLSGHSDRIGNEEYNQQLSEDRAYSIKNYLSSRGFSREKITVKGMGSLYPLTNQVCKDIENKPLLISCLAPDRRVEIEVISNNTK